MSSLTPVRDDRSATAETFRSLDHALGFYGFPQKRRRDRTRSLFYVALLRRGSCPGRTRNQPAKEFATQSTLSTPPHGIAAEPPDRGTLRLQTPLRLQPPMAVSDLGLALPCEPSDCFPAPPDFSTGAFHNRSPHNWNIHEQAPGASAKSGLIPGIHRG